MPSPPRLPAPVLAALAAGTLLAGPAPARAAQGPALAADCDGARAAVAAALAAHAPVLMQDAFVVAGCDRGALDGLRALVVAGSYAERTLTACQLGPALQGRPSRLDAKALTSGCEGPACGIDVYAPTDWRPPVCPEAVAGRGLWSLLACHALVQGHSDITRGSLAGQLTGDGLALVTDASQDPDFYQWTAPCAHAQNRNDGRTGELVDLDHARPRFVRWEAAALQRMLGACDGGDLRRALYWFGYALHGVQDVVFHEGISNAEHAYRDGVEHEGIDCRQPRLGRKLELATRATQAFAAEVKRRHGACWEAMARWRAPEGERAGLSLAEKAALHGHGWDLDPWPYLRLADLVKERRAADPSTFTRVVLEVPGQRWLHDLDATLLGTILGDPRLWPDASASAHLLALDCSEE